MIVYRIAKLKYRATDISGAGAHTEGGRWNNPGTYALYTSENRALAALEMLVHAEETELPPHLFIMTIAVDDKAPVYKVKDKELPTDWRMPENIALKERGDKLLAAGKYIAIKARSAVMPNEYNYILNPLYPGYQAMVKVMKVDGYAIDDRLL